MDRREIVEVFRERLGEVIGRSGLSRSAFAGEIGHDRSTLSQLLSPEHVRLPRAETIAAIAERAQVSVDWLLGLSQEGQLGADMLPQALELEIEPGGSSLADERLKRWHAEAAGYKIRYVPSSLPDLLKTEAVIRYEFQTQDSRLPKVRMEEAERRLAYSRRPETDMEVCSSAQSLEGFARGEGIWSGVSVEDRRDQIDRMIRTLDELYPTPALVSVRRPQVLLRAHDHFRPLARGGLYRRHVPCPELDRAHSRTDLPLRQSHSCRGGAAARRGRPAEGLAPGLVGEGVQMGRIP